MKILIVGNLNTIFTYEYITEIAIKIYGSEITVLNNRCKEETNSDRIQFLYENGVKIIFPPKRKVIALKKIPHPFIIMTNFMRFKICREFDVIHILFVTVDAVAAALFSKRYSKIIASIYGSDLLRAGRFKLLFMRMLARRANYLTVASSYMKEKALRQLGAGITPKIEIIKYGTKNVEIMKQAFLELDQKECKKEFNFPTEKLCIVCGYNGSPAHRHLTIIKELEQLSTDVKNGVFLIFPFGYGAEESYITQIEKVLANSSIQGVIVRRFMQGKELAKFRYCGDIMLNLQETDALSASMIESMEAGAIVIKGDWLRYPDLEEMSIYMESISNMDELSKMISKIFYSYDDRKKRTMNNKGVIDMISWSTIREKWQGLYTTAGIE